MPASTSISADHSLLDGDFLPANYHGRIPDPVFQSIIDDIAAGVTLESSAPAHNTSHDTVWRNISREPARCELYARAKRIGILREADRLLAIADDDSGDVGIMASANVNRAKLRVDARKWLLSKLASAVYGDRVELTGSSDSPLRIVISKDDNDL